MAIIFCDGFDHYDDDWINKKWDYTEEFPFGSVNIAPGLGRFGTNALSMTDSWRKVLKAMPHGPLGYVTAGVAFNPRNGLVVAPAGIISFVTGTTTLCGVAVTETHNLYYFSGNYVAYANKPIRTNAFNYVEIQVQRFHGVTGIVKIWLNEVLVLDLLYVNSNASSSTSLAEAVQLGGHMTWQRTSYSQAILYDDFYMTDNNGDSESECLGNLGDVRILEQMPIADHDKEWTTSDSGDNYEMVDDAYDAIDDDDTYITAQVVDTKDTYAFPELPPGNYDVKAVCMNFYAKKLDSGSRGVSMLAHRASDYAAADENLIGGNYIYYQSFMEYDIDGVSTWTVPNVEATYFGPKLTT